MEYHAFLSYSSVDRSFAKRLHDDLTALGFRIWWDEHALRSRGRNAATEIRDVILASGQHFLLLVGRTTLERVYVIEELALAVRECKIVVPLRLSGCPPLPPHLDKLPRRDFGDQASYTDTLEQVVADLRTDTKRLKLLRGDIPRDSSISGPVWLRRGDLIDRLSECVASGGPTDITSIVQTTKLHGMGGIGKSVLAAQFVRECHIRRRFPDGVIWTKAGAEERLERILERIGQDLDLPGHDPSRYSDEPSALKSLSTRLRRQSCLIVLDDVRQFAQLEFVRRALAESPASHLLVTTRLAGLASNLAREVSVDLPDDTEARQLLLRYSTRAPEPDPDVAARIVSECGRLPLALAVVGSMISEPDDWDHALERLENAEIEEIAADITDYDHRSLFRALDVSVENLVPELAERYIDLVVFQGNPIPDSAVELLWRARSRDAARWIKELVGRNLLGRNEVRRLTMHDLQYDYVRARARDRPESIASLHGRLLDGYERGCSKAWATLKDDGYILQSLVGHLLAAGRAKEVHDLLWPVGSANAWYERKRLILGSYIDDVRAAWAAVRSQNEPRADALPRDLILEIRYALISSSLAGMRKSIPAAVLCAALERGLAGEDEALTLALNEEYLPVRAETLASLSQHLTGAAKKTAEQEASRAFRSGRLDRDWLWISGGQLVSILPEPEIRQALGEESDSAAERALLLARLAELGYPEEALEKARSIRDDQQKAQALAAIATFVEGDARRKALAEAKQKAQHGSHIVGWLAGLGALDDALELYRERGGGFDCRIAIVRCALKDGDSDRALRLARELAWDNLERAVLLAEIAPSLAEERRPSVVEEARRCADAPLLIPENYDENRRQCLALASVAPFCKDGDAILERLLSRALDGKTSLLRNDGLDILARRLPPSLFQCLWDAVRRQNDHVAVARARVGIACCLPKPGKSQRLVEVLALLDWREVPEYLVGELVGGLADEGPQEAARSLERAFTQDGVSQTVIEQLLAYAPGSRAPAKNPPAAQNVAESLPAAGSDRHAIETRLKETRSEEEKAILFAMASRFQDFGEARESLKEALKIAVAHRIVSLNSGLLEKVIKVTPREQRGLALNLAEEALAGKNRSHILVPIIERAAEAGFNQAALESAERCLSPGRDRAMVFAQIARHLPDHSRRALLRRALDEACVGDPLDQAHTRHLLFPFLDPDMWHENQSKLDLNVYLGEFTSALADLAKYLSPDRLGEAFELAAGMDHPGRPDALRSLATRLVALDEGELLLIWRQGLPRLAQRSRAELLADIGALAPVITRLGGTEVLDAVDQSIGNSILWWP